MRYLILAIAMVIFACNNNREKSVTGDTLVIHDTVCIDNPIEKVYANERFKEVTVERVGQHKFIIKGKGQIFEANFGWVIEDGHNEIKKGNEMTDAGAPEWGNFAFVVDAQKQKQNTTLHLILFEESAKDGSRQHQLPVLLY